MSAVHFKLNNLIVIIDRNNFQQTGKSDEIMIYNDLKKMWDSFGFFTKEVDGHNINQLLEVLEKNNSLEKPTAIIANTIKGKGISFTENDNNWHHAVLTKKMYEKAKQELE